MGVRHPGWTRDRMSSDWSHLCLFEVILFFFEIVLHLLVSHCDCCEPLCWLLHLFIVVLWKSFCDSLQSFCDSLQTFGSLWSRFVTLCCHFGTLCSHFVSLCSRFVFSEVEGLSLNSGRKELGQWIPLIVLMRSQFSWLTVLKLSNTIQYTCNHKSEYNIPRRSVYSILPFIMGKSLHTPSPPTEVNCPKDVSKKKRGIPANTRVMKYGMRKAPDAPSQSRQDQSC